MDGETTRDDFIDLALGAASLDDIANNLVPMLMDRANANGGSLLVRRDDVLVVQTSYGLKTNRANRARIPLGVGVTGRAAQTGSIQWIPDVDAVDNHIEGVSNSVWELAIPVTHPDRKTSLVLDLESNTPDRPDQKLRSRIAESFRSIKFPVLNLAENERLRSRYRRDSVSPLMDGEYFLEYMDDWFREHPDRSGLFLVMMLEPELEDPQVSSFQELRTEIQSLGAELQSLGFEECFNARLYGNLFAMLLPDVGEEEASEVRNTVRTELLDRCTVKQINSSYWHAEDSDVETLVDTAFVSLNFTETDQTASNKSRELDEILREGDISLSQQPIVESSSREVVGHEIFVRGPEGSGLRSPKNLFKTAYQQDRVVALDTLIARKALRTYRGDPTNTLFLNVERKSLVDDGWRESLIHLFQNGTGVRNLCIEITEHGNMTDIREPLREIRDELNSSVQFAIDDFGTGSSNFEAIIDLDPDVLKIDRSLIQNLDEEFGKRSLIESILNFSTTTDLRLLAEGIETDSEWSVLREMGVEWAQGYFFAKPEPV